MATKTITDVIICLTNTLLLFLGDWNIALYILKNFYRVLIKSFKFSMESSSKLREANILLFKCETLE